MKLVALELFAVCGDCTIFKCYSLLQVHVTVHH